MRTSRRCALLAALPIALSAAFAAPQASSASAQTANPAVRHHEPTAMTKIVVMARTDRGAVHDELLGVNHQYSDNGYGVWDAAHDRPNPRVVREMKRAHVTLVRYPGGIVANLFDWKKAIGADRGCQVDARANNPHGYMHVHTGSAYGPDEHMEIVNAVGAKALMMVPWISESPRDAADWVEYMNSPAHTKSNPNGGRNWANVRARNGHPEPYHVHIWEIGNEQRIDSQRYWMSSDTQVAARQYVNGANVRIKDELLGKNCNHPKVGERSNGKGGQVFQALYPPVQPNSMKITIGSQTWTEVSDLDDAGPRDRVFSIDDNTGNVTFGDGTHGAIPPKGQVVQATYHSVHKGVFAFIRAMKKVDPSIEACPSWGRAGFLKAARGHRYSCFTTHSYTHFQAEGHADWTSPLNGHDWHMLGAKTELRFLTRLKDHLPKGTELPVSEMGALYGDTAVYPTWATSMTHAIYMTTRWIQLAYLGIPWATGNELVADNSRGLFGNAPYYVYSAEALARQAIWPMFKQPGHLLLARILNNRVRYPSQGGSYPALVVGADRDNHGHIVVTVVNQLPLEKQVVGSGLVVQGASLKPKVKIDTVDGATFQSANTRRHKHAVRITRTTEQARTHGLTYTFPPHSITVLHFTLKGTPKHHR